jgi:phage terminase large subunit
MIPKHKKIWDILGSKTRYFIITGGRGSGKSFEVGRFTSLLSFQKGHTILFTRQTMTSAHLSIIPEFQNKIELLNMDGEFDINKTEIVNRQSGSKILFKGIKTSSGDQTANLKSLQGVTTWILDEAEEQTDEKVFDKINLSIRQKGIQNRVILIMNPATKEHWIYKRFFENAGVPEGFTGIKNNVTYIHTTYLDNEDNLDESFLDEVKNLKETNPIKYKHTILGGWLDKAEGVVFTNWKLGKFIEVNPSIYGQDFGFSIDPTTLVQTSIDKSNKRIYIKELVYKAKLTTTEIFELNQRYCDNKLIIADSAEPRLIHELRVRGNNIKETIKGPGSVSAGLALMQDYELIIDPDSTNIVKELNNYTWSDRKSDTPIDAFNHSIDAIRYAVYFQLHKLSKGNTILG